MTKNIVGNGTNTTWEFVGSTELFFKDTTNTREIHVYQNISEIADK